MNKLRVLMIDDSEEDVYAFERVFTEGEERAEIISFTDAQIAKEYVTKTGDYTNGQDPLPNIVILDINMPKIDGFEFLEILNSLDDYKHIPTIILSTSNEESSVLKAHQLGVASYIHKPVDFGKFKEVINTLKKYWLEVATLPHLK